MKKILLLLVFTIELFSQGELLDGAPEFYVCVVGFPDWSDHEFQIEEISFTTYCNSDWPYGETFIDCDDCGNECCLESDTEVVTVGPGGGMVVIKMAGVFVPGELEQKNLGTAGEFIK